MAKKGKNKEVKKKLVKGEINLTNIARWMNDEFMEKKNNSPFNVQDVQNYIRRGRLPSYVGNYVIERVDNPYVAFYDIYEILED